MLAWEFVLVFSSDEFEKLAGAAQFKQTTRQQKMQSWLTTSTKGNRMPNKCNENSFFGVSCLPTVPSNTKVTSIQYRKQHQSSVKLASQQQDSKTRSQDSINA